MTARNESIIIKTNNDYITILANGAAVDGCRNIIITLRLVITQMPWVTTACVSP
jgi:hypothetical protein